MVEQGDFEAGKPERRRKESLSLLSKVVFVFMVFAMMVAVSCIYVNGMLSDHLDNDAMGTLIEMSSQMDDEFSEARSLLTVIAQTVRGMVVAGEDEDTVLGYMDGISRYLEQNPSDSFQFTNIISYFEAFDGKLYSTMHWNPPEGYDPTVRPWFQTAVAAEGEVAFTDIYENLYLGDYAISFSQRIFDDEGVPLGVVCISVPLDRIREMVVDMKLTENGFGMLLDGELNVIAHQNDEYWGLPFREINSDVTQIADDLQHSEDVRGRVATNYVGDESVFYYYRLRNGWILGLVTPKGEYYNELTTMILFLGILGVVLASTLSIILLRIDAARSEADYAKQYQRSFLAMMSHEIRTPMNSIIGMTTIGETADGIERKDYCFSKIKDASKHLLGVINDILDMSKIEANKLEMSPVEFEFKAMLERVVVVSHYRVEEKRQTLTVDVDDAIPNTLVGDDQRLAQVITNLLSNAVKFTGEGGAIRLEAYSMGETEGIHTIQIQVTDTGIGISPEQQTHLFQSFQQAETSTTRKYGGTGLGLSISKRIVEMMGGEIWVESELGKGSTFGFTVQVKCGSEGEVDEPIEKRVNREGLFAGRRALLAEDVEINREILLTMMESTQLAFDCAENGAEALRMFKEAPERYDVILMDVQMPEMDGYDATLRIRALEDAEGAKPIPILAMTANVFREDVEKCLEVGMNDHLGKPLDLDEIIEKLRRYLT